MISHTLTNIQPGKTYQLQSYIDNRDSKALVALKFITYWVGWYNITGKQYLKTQQNTIFFEDGLYNFNDLKDIFSNESIGLSVNARSGIATIEIPKGTQIQLSSGILSLLGIVSKHGLLTAGRHVGTKMIDFAGPKELRVEVDQINSENNFVNGSPSRLLAIVPISDKPFGKAVSYRFDNPSFKQVMNGCITELTVRITDENGIPVDNHGLPITVELLVQYNKIYKK